MNEIRPKELAQRYMELRYAIRPLIYDVNGIIAVLEKDTRLYDRFTGRGSASATASTGDLIEGHSIEWNATADTERSATYYVSARAGVLYHVNVNQLRLLGVDQLLETAWELIPFSFIVDWFVGVGQAIAAATPTIGATQLASWVTVKETFVSSNRMGNTRSTYSDETYPGGNIFSWSSEYGQRYSISHGLLTLN
jgi:hypothetical protein